MEIRRLAHDDLAALLNLYGHLHEEYYDISNKAFAEEWAKILAAGNIFYFGLFVNSHLVSSCHLVVVSNLTHACQPYALIENVVTHSAHRNRGFGKAVLHAALEYAWAQGCYKTMLMTGRNEEKVHRFYESAGFTSTDKKAFVARPLGK